MQNNIESGKSFQKEQKEQEPQWRLKKRIVICGHPGNGKGTLIDALSAKYGLKRDGQDKQVFIVGDMFREWSQRETGIIPTGYINREISVDKNLDQYQMSLLANSDPNKLFILESRLGGFFSWQVRENALAEGRPEPPIFTILLTVKPKEGNRRVFERDRKYKPLLTREESDRETELRKRKDFKRWQELYPILKETGSPLSWRLRGLYDSWVDTTELGKKEVVGKIHEILIKEDVVEKVYPTNKTDLPTSGQIFPKPV